MSATGCPHRRLSRLMHQQRCRPFRNVHPIFRQSSPWNELKAIELAVPPRQRVAAHGDTVEGQGVRSPRSSILLAGTLSARTERVRANRRPSIGP
jgi:hypothetical protein